MSSKGIMAAMLVLVFLIPGAYSLTVNLAGSQAGSSFFDTMTFNALDRDSLSVQSTINGASLEQVASGSGDLHKSFAANSHRGEKAQITADVVNAGSWEYTQPAIAADTASASVTGFSLSANDADTIKCNTGATDRLGDKTSAAVEVYQGSLSNYHGDAYASSSRVTAAQSFDSADGAQVLVKEMASNPTGSTITNTNVQNGGISGYTNFGATFVDPQLMETVGQFEFAEGNTIGVESSAYKTSGYRSNAKMDVQDGLVFGYLSAAGVGLGFKTGAQQIIVGEADGRVIGLTASSSNNERDTSSLKTDVQITEAPAGFISGYSDITESFQDSVFANNFFGQAGGDEIHLSSSASNRENDRANANMHAVGNGQITNYEGSSSATLKTAFASSGSIGLGTSILGNEIGYGASASDAARNNASVKTMVLDGDVVGAINSASVDNTFGQDLTASQSATVLWGPMMEIDATAINGAKHQESLNTPFINSNGIRYDNFASVVFGIPNVLNPRSYESLE